MKKFLVFLGIVIIVAIIAFPISNLIFKPHSSTVLTDAKKDDPLFTKAATVLQKKCMHCHSTGAALPFYASFPIAKSIIQKDIKTGLSYFDFQKELLPAGKEPVSEVALAKLEHAVTHDTMPPLRYFLLHLDASLSSAEKKDVLNWIHSVRRKNYATPGYPPEVQNQVLQPLPKTISLDNAKVALGNKLYHDKRLSGDNTIACASCHELGKGGTDQRQFSVGIKEQVGDINAPTTYNSGYQFLQFWDGRAANLEEQADGPVNNPIEMGSNWEQVIGKLSQDEAFVEEFTAVYPNGLSSGSIVNAIAEFERSLITPNSRFDRYLAGDKNALTSEEKKGYKLFISHRCATCHVGKILGGQSFEKMGLKKDYFADRGNIHKPDYGRFNVTKDEADKYKFKVPTLRNIALTFPYFHDGSTKDLKEAVKTMSKYQWGDEFTDDEADSVVKFLLSLTGEYQGKSLE